MKLLSVLVIALLTVAPVCGVAQTKPEFEVASIHPLNTGQGDSVTLGVKIDGAQIRIGMGMIDILTIAYRTKAYQIIGPDWLTSERFDVSAKLPAGANADQIPEMLQSLLSERFGLRIHRDKKEMPVYALRVDKPPLKLKEVAI